MLTTRGRRPEIIWGAWTFIGQMCFLSRRVLTLRCCCRSCTLPWFGSLQNRALPPQASCTAPVPIAGTYHVVIGIQTKPNKGIFQLAIDSLNFGNRKTNTIRVSPTVFEIWGWQRFRLLVTTRSNSPSQARTRAAVAIRSLSSFAVSPVAIDLLQPVSL